MDWIGIYSVFATVLVWVLLLVLVSSFYYLAFKGIKYKKTYLEWLTGLTLKKGKVAVFAGYAYLFIAITLSIVIITHFLH